MNSTLHSLKINRTLNASREKVFAAFSSAESMCKWFVPHRDIKIEPLEFDFVMGGGYRLKYSMLDGTTPVLCGLFEIIDPPTQLAFTWIWEAPDKHAEILTRVHVVLRDMGVKTELELVHEQIPTSDMAERHKAGWEATLDILETIIEPKGNRDPTSPTKG